MSIGFDGSSKSSQSTHQIQWRSRSDVAIFVRALHLLDLDLLPDFPGISESTFTSSASAAPSSASVASPVTSQSYSLQSRIKAVEWSFYRLLEIYDAEGMRRAKLAAYFPPTAPLQSLNLRAAIYKWLTELKKDGVLPRDIVLRKTMLDECKGEKFEELLAAFAMLVLRKALAKNAGKSQVMSTMEAKTRQMTDRKVLIPLILAHRVTLHRSYEKRRELHRSAHSRAHGLGVLRDNIMERLAIAQQPADAQELSAEEHEVLRDQINHTFAADRDWAAYLFHGNPAATSLSTATEQALQSLSEESSLSVSPKGDLSQDVPRSPRADGPMHQLQQTVLEHETRVRRLQHLRESLLASTERPLSASSTPALAPGSAESCGQAERKESSAGPRFNRHHTLKLTSLSV